MSSLGERKYMGVYLPVDAIAVSFSVTRDIGEGDESDIQVVVSCADADVDVHDALSGNSYIHDSETDTWELYAPNVVEDEDEDEDEDERE